MNRVEILRKYIDEILLNLCNEEECRMGYVHLYGVAQACALIALKRGENAELATMAGMLHDIYTYSKKDSKDHAHKGASLAREILVDLEIATDEEIHTICSAIYNHSEKDKKHCAFDEVLIDADVLQHCLYNPSFEVKEHEKMRFLNLKKEVCLG